MSLSHARRHGRERGDTVIEVLLAITILSVVIVAAITMMNRGHSMALDSLERTQVTALMTEQSEILHYIRDSYDPGQPSAAGTPAALWESIVDSWTAPISEDPCAANARPFYLGKNTAAGGDIAVSLESFNENTINESSSEFVETHARPGEGMWIEAEMPAVGAGGIEYIDFHIKGCWRPAGQGPLQHSKTIVRLYAPSQIAVAALAPPAAPGGAVVPGGNENNPGNPSPECVRVNEAFQGDISLTTNPGDMQKTRGLTGVLRGGCTYDVVITYGDRHTDQMQACNNGNTAFCESLSQGVEEWFYVEGMSGSTVVVPAFPQPHTPDVPADQDRLQLNAAITIPEGQNVTVLRFTHPPLQNPTGKSWVDGNSVHIYGYDFIPR